MKPLLISRKTRVFYVNLFARFPSVPPFPEHYRVENGTVPNERVDCSPVRCREKRISREANFPGGLFLPPCVYSRKRLLFQRNFYIYPSVKRKPRICFYSRLLLVTSHSSFPLLFRKPPAAVLHGLVLRVLHIHTHTLSLSLFFSLSLSSG